MRTTLVSLLTLSVLFSSSFSAAKKSERSYAPPPVSLPWVAGLDRGFSLIYLGGGDQKTYPSSPVDALLKEEFELLSSVGNAVRFVKKSGNDRRAYVCKTGEGPNLIVTMPEVVDGVIVVTHAPESAFDTPASERPQLETFERPAWRIVCPDYNPPTTESGTPLFPLPPLQ